MIQAWSVPLTWTTPLLSPPVAAIFGQYADTPTLIIGTHFAGPTAGKLVRDGDGYRLNV